MYESHFFRCSHADDAQTDLEHAARRIGQLQAGVAHEGLCVLDAADIVEAVETRGQLRHIAVDAAGIVIARSEVDLLREHGELLDELALLRRREQRCVDIRRGGHGAAALRHGSQQRADARVRILDVVDGVFAVLPHCEVEVELEVRVRLGVEEEAAGSRP